MDTAPRYAFPEAIVSTEWLAANLRDPALRVFDCTTYLLYETGTGRPYRVGSGRPDYEAGHIPGSAFLDLQGELSDTSSRFNFTMPAADDLAARFAARASATAPASCSMPGKACNGRRGSGGCCGRSASTMRRSSTAASTNGRPRDGRPRPPRHATRRRPVAAQPRPGLFIGKDEVKAAIGDAGACTINALAPDLHRGENPRYGRPGRIPGSVNVPAAALLDPEALTIRPPEAVAASFAAVGADPSKRILLYCGGGIAATLDAFLLHQLGYRDIAVYDASMSEWAKDESPCRSSRADSWAGRLARLLLNTTTKRRRRRDPRVPA